MYHKSIYEYFTDDERQRIKEIFDQIDKLNDEKYDIYNRAQARAMAEMYEKEE